MNSSNFLTATVGHGSSVIAIITFMVIIIALLWIPILNNPALFKNKKTVIKACVETGVGIVVVLLMQYIPWTIVLAVMMVTCVIMTVRLSRIASRTKIQQNQPNAKTAHKKNNRIESLTKLKELLDSGAITQEEFEEKKKELLDL